ncbi:NUDIX hydrolase [Acidovorax sp. RAC01]|uniref:NUDIX hydrolase n=1 Tax=Acidovorax sp. RAC01 TaxID=1842533 RepID=UPI00083E7396|nr:NUDIX domain-containing protein [Acidovorax sp. RAC01]
MSSQAQGTAFAQWVATARQQALQAAPSPRQPLVAAGHVVGSVAEGFLEENGFQGTLHEHCLLLKKEHSGGVVWHLDGAADEITPALNALASALRDQGLCGPWRDEQLAVCNAAGDVVATVERGAVRVLGITTRAVHLVGRAPDGRIWVQKRAMTKPSNPGQWDTLMGGMVSAADTLQQALARETWEEAGLRVDDLHHLAHGGHVAFSRPSREGGGAGFMVERIDWFHAVVPEGMQPDNQDGEVECFALLHPDEVRACIADGGFTLEAGLVLADFFGV